jgi:GTPase SAR1 family protein/RNase P/RNase MRP subunit POP5
MATSHPEPASLEQLQSGKQRALLDAIDNLRQQGVNNYDISIPQLIVCGDQSSGKSSVLEGITRLRFPTKDGLCTTFATELILRREPETHITCSIIPGKSRTTVQRSELVKFKRSYTTGNEFSSSFPSLVEEAKRCMTFGATSDVDKFFEDTLQIRYVGNDVPSLTIVDLPGLIQSDLEGRQGDNVTRVRELVEGYMQDDKSIILAVVSARNDLENQAVIRKVQQFDPKASRTLGIITKPDTLDTGSESEAKFIRLAKNELTRLELGWHVVMNRSLHTRNQTNAERDESEKKFFERGLWKDLPQASVGVDTLRKKLSDVLTGHICKELPALTVAIQEAVVTTQSKLDALGDPRDNLEQQRYYLTRSAERFQIRTVQALRATYDEPAFFELTSHDRHPATLLRTQVQNLNIAFAHLMHCKGHTYDIVDFSNSQLRTTTRSSEEYQQYDAAFEPPESIERDGFLEHIQELIERSRGAGFTTLANPWVIGVIFREQSASWIKIAEYHVQQTIRAVRDYLHLALESLIDSRTFNMIMLEIVEPLLETRCVHLRQKLQELLLPYQEQYQMTYDPSFVIDLNNARDRRSVFKFNGVGNQEGILNQSRESHRQLLVSADSYTSSDILDLMETYYKVSHTNGTLCLSWHKENRINTA